MSYPFHKIFLLFSSMILFGDRLYAQTISSPLYSVPGFSKTTAEFLHEWKDLKSKLDLDEFQYKQIVKISIDYHNRILDTIHKYNIESGRHRMLLHIAMATVDHDARIGDLLNKKQRKIWYDFRHNQRTTTYLKLLKKKTCKTNPASFNW